MEKIANLKLFEKVGGKETVLNQGEMGLGEKCITQRDYHAMVTNNVTNKLVNEPLVKMDPKRDQ